MPLAVLYCCCKKHPSARSCFDCITSKVTETIIENVFSAMLKKSPDEDGKQVYTIFNYRVPEGYKLHLLAVMFNLVGVALIQFVRR